MPRPIRPALPPPGRGKARSHPGNKAALPSKPCAACGRPMSWRRAWAKVWEEVRYCSEACRRQRGATNRARTDA